MKLFAFPLLLLCIISIAIAAAPTQEESKFYGEMQKRFALHKDLAELPVDKAMSTLEKPIEVTFPCPNPPPQQGRIKISTKLVAWDGKAGEAGHYDWLCSVEVSDKEKYMECNNEIMFDLSRLLPENGLDKQADNVRIYYHEWLHSQLLIDAMSTKGWQEQFCMCHTDFGPADLDDPHSVIPKYDLPFKENLTARIVTMDDPWNITGKVTPHKIPEFSFSPLLLFFVSLTSIIIFRRLNH